MKAGPFALRQTDLVAIEQMKHLSICLKRKNVTLRSCPKPVAQLDDGSFRMDRYTLVQPPPKARASWLTMDLACADLTALVLSVSGVEK